MHFTQLRYVQETVRQAFNLTSVGNTVFATQSGISRRIKELEEELGVTLFERRGKRLLGLTNAGQQLLPLIERILLDSQNLKDRARQLSDDHAGELVIATTHTQARYALVEIITAFQKRYPHVKLSLQQGSPQTVADLLARGDADIGIATEALSEHHQLTAFAAYDWHHCIVLPNHHPLVWRQASHEAITLELLADYPIITYEAGFTGRKGIDAAFHAADLEPDVVLTAIDADVIKTYVEAGCGIGIIAEMAYNPKRDTELVKLDAKHLFSSNNTKIAIRRGAFLRRYTIEFIQLFAPHIDPNLLSVGAEE